MNRLKILRKSLKKTSAAVIYADYEMAEYALKFGCPIVTNDKFRSWRNGTEKNKKVRSKAEEWAVIFRQRVLHKMDGNRRITTIPPLQHEQTNFVVESQLDQQAREILKLKEENEMLKRRNELIMATNTSLRKESLLIQEGTSWFGMNRGQKPASRLFPRFLSQTKFVEVIQKDSRANATLIRKLFETRGAKFVPLKILRLNIGRL